MPILSPKLKPCANCGGRGKFHIVSDQRSKNWNGEYIECSNIQCGISTPIMFPAMESVKEALADIWNRRPRQVRNALRKEVLASLDKLGL